MNNKNNMHSPYFCCFRFLGGNVQALFPVNKIIKSVICLSRIFYRMIRKSEKKAPSKIDKTSQLEKQRRLRFLLKLGVFLFIILIRHMYDDFLKNNLGVTENQLRAVVFFSVAYITIMFARLSLVVIYLRRHHQVAGFRNNFIIGINQITNLLSYVVFFISILLLLDIEPKEFFTSISIIAAAIAITFKDYITNMINGLIVMFSDQLTIEDYVKIGEYKGKIVDITLMNVHLLSEDDDLIYISNSTILTSNIINLTKNNQKKITLEFSLQPNQIEGLNEMEQHLVDSMQPYEEHIRPESMHMRVTNINNNSVTIKFQLILNKQDRRMERDIRRHLNWNIISYINESKRHETA
jgi:small-conductance mechanosensitive channel